MYVIGDLAWSSFGIVLVLYALTFWSFEGLAQMLSTFSNVIIGLFGFLNLYFAAFLFCGMFVDPEDVVWPIRTFCYFMPLGWTLQSYMYALMHDMPDHEGTVACTPGDALPTGGVCTDQGFYCYSSEDPTGAVCYGKDGDTILESLSVQFTIFEAKGHYARNIALIVAFGALTRIGYVAAIYVLTKMYGGQAPGAPGDDVAVAMGDDEDDSFRSRSSETNPGMPHSKSGADIKLSVAEIEAFDAAVDAKDGTGVEFAFKNICYSIAGKKKDEPDAAVLRDVSGSVREGEILAIVGPSGAGKTILLDTLTFNKGPGAPSGEISLNGKKMTRSDFAKDAIYVPREDNLWPTMSPRQHVEFAFKMYRSDLVTKAARDKEVDELLSVTGLTSCADTKAGGFLFKGLSGGQRRRLSLAVALVKQPSLIVLDEPTSGLDSAAAAAILTLLARVARSRRAAVICTIHQPSALVFAGFHKVLVLSGGRVAYCGPRKEMAAHFESVGAALSHDANPAEAVLDLVSKDTTSEAQVTAVLDGWETSERRQKVASEASGKHAAFRVAPAAHGHRRGRVFGGARLRASGAFSARGPAAVRRPRVRDPAARRVLRVGVPSFTQERPEAGALPAVLPVVGPGSSRVHVHHDAHRHEPRHVLGGVRTPSRHVQDFLVRYERRVGADSRAVRFVAGHKPRGVRGGELAVGQLHDLRGAVRHHALGVRLHGAAHGGVVQEPGDRHARLPRVLVQQHRVLRPRVQSHGRCVAVPTLLLRPSAQVDVQRERLRRVHALESVQGRFDLRRRRGRHALVGRRRRVPRRGLLLRRRRHLLRVLGRDGRAGAQHAQFVVREPRHGRRPRVRYRHLNAHGLRPQARVRRHAVARRRGFRRAEENQTVIDTARDRSVRAMKGPDRETRKREEKRRPRCDVL
jgi:ABC-type multidrug transport system ATPase subunit